VNLKQKLFLLGLVFVGSSIFYVLMEPNSYPCILGYGCNYNLAWILSGWGLFLIYTNRSEYKVVLEEKKHD
jgi:hypothetical protein